MVARMPERYDCSNRGLTSLPDEVQGMRELRELYVYDNQLTTLPEWIGELTELQTEIAAWADKTNAKQRGVDWQFRIENARTKLKRLYPIIELQ